MSNEAKVFHSVEEAAGKFGPCAIAIGNFDGVHVGHQKLIQAARDYADAHAFSPAVLTFHPHPVSVLAPEKQFGFVSTIEERVRLLISAGARRILVLPFTEELSRVTAFGFVSQILVNALETKGVFVGENFRFGHGQGGTTETLQELGDQLGFVSQILPPVRVRGEVVSSSAIRRYVEAAKMALAARMLGRWFSVAGTVVSGLGVGSKQTVPTLNLLPSAGQVLPRGVFVTETIDRDSGRRWESITNVGNRPTFAGDDLTIETFLLSEFDGNAPADIEVRFCRFVRSERRFDSPEVLKAQIFKDVARARSYWRRAEAFRRALVSYNERRYFPGK